MKRSESIPNLDMVYGVLGDMGFWVAKQNIIILKEKSLSKILSLFLFTSGFSKNWVVPYPVYASYCGNGFYIFLFGNTKR